MTDYHMKVGYVLQRFPVLSETFVLDEILWLKKKGIDVSVFSFEASPDEIAHKQAGAVAKDTFYALNPKTDMRSFIRVLKSNVRFFFRSPLNYTRFFFTHIFRMGKKEFLQIFYLCSLMERQGLRRIHAHFACLGTTAAMIISRFLKIPFSFTVHAHDIFVEDDFLEEKLKSAEYAVAVSEYNKKYLLEKFTDIPLDKIKVAHCGVDVDKFKPVDIRPGGEARILSGGRFIEKKGFTYLVKACGLLVNKGIKVRCDIFGDGPLKEALREEVKKSGLKEQIHFIGAVDRDKLLQLLAKSEIFLLPAVVARDGDREGIPVTLMEAMSCRKAVVSTKISGIPELIDSMDNGVLVPEKDEYALAEAVEKLLKDRTLRERLGWKAREKIVDKFNIWETTAALANLFSGPSCNLCGGTDAFIVSSHISADRIEYNHKRCKGCGLICAEPMPELSDEEMSRKAAQLWYDKFMSDPDKFDWGHLKRYEEHNELRVEALEKYKKGKRVLEVGCGNGYFLVAARKRGWEVFGVDICRELCSYINKHLKLKTFCGSLKEAGFEDSYFDAIYLNNILEHLPDPTGFLKEVYRVLKDDGVIFLSVPNTGNFFDCIRRMASLLGVKGIWKGYIDPPMHLYGYTAPTLKKILEKCGFKPLKLFTVGKGDKVYYPDFSKPSLKKAIERSISFTAIPFGRRALLNAYAIKDRDG